MCLRNKQAITKNPFDVDRRCINRGLKELFENMEEWESAYCKVTEKVKGSLWDRLTTGGKNTVA